MVDGGWPSGLFLFDGTGSHEEANVKLLQAAYIKIQKSVPKAPKRAFTVSSRSGFFHFFQTEIVRGYASVVDFVESHNDWIEDA